MAFEDIATHLFGADAYPPNGGIMKPYVHDFVRTTCALMWNRWRKNYTLKKRSVETLQVQVDQLYESASSTPLVWRRIANSSLQSLKAHPARL